MSIIPSSINELTVCEIPGITGDFAPGIGGTSIALKFISGKSSFSDSIS